MIGSNILNWIQTGGLIGLLALSVKLYIDNRRIRIEEKRADHQGFSDLIKALSEDVAGVREQLRHCQEQHDETKMELDGLRRQFISYQLAVAHAVPPTMRTPEINAMIGQVEKFMKPE